MAVGPSWQIVATTAGQETFLPQWADLKVTQTIGQADTVNFSCPGDDPVAAVSLTELVTDITVVRNTTRITRTRLLTVDDSLDADKYTIDVNSADYRQLIEEREILTDLTFTAVPDTQIVWTLIGQIQAATSGSFGITLGLYPTGTPRTVVFPAGMKYGKAIRTLAEQSPGFDWWIDTAKQVNMAVPRRVASPSGAILEYRGNVSKARRRSVAKDYGNYWRVTGGKGTVPQVASQLPDVKGRWERSENDTTLDTTAAVLARAQLRLANSKDPRADWQVTLDGGVFGVSFTGELGDLVQWRAKRGRLVVDRPCRIVERSFEVGADGSETVSMILREEP